MDRVKTKLGELPVNYGMNAMAMYSEERGIGMDQVFNIDDGRLTLMDYMCLLYVGLKDGARKAGEECKFKSVIELMDYADDNTEIVTDISTIFANQTTRKKKEKEEAKKK